MVSGAYDPRFVQVLSNGRRHQAHTYVVDRTHEQYAGRLTAEETAALIRQGVGARGSCTDYLAATVAHLDELGIPDHFKNADFVTVEDAGHWVHHDKLDEFLKLVREFL